MPAFKVLAVLALGAALTAPQLSLANDRGRQMPRTDAERQAAYERAMARLQVTPPPPVVLRPQGATASPRAAQPAASQSAPRAASQRSTTPAAPRGSSAPAANSEQRR
jgi:hypothetical protein